MTKMQRTDFSAMSRLSADIDLLAEGKATGFVRVPHSVHRSAYGWIPIPIVRIKNGDGPSVLMQAGNHGDEWEGQIGLGNLIRALQPKDIKGRLVILPSANFPAAMEGRRTSPIDEGNLNRSFPGDAEGTITQQIAYWIEHSLLPGFDYSFDFHSGGSSLTYIPSALAPKHEDAARLQKVIGMLKAFGAPVSYLASAPQGGGKTFTSASARQGVFSMGTELGGGGLVTPGSLKVAEDGMRRVLAHIGLLQGTVCRRAASAATACSTWRRMLRDRALSMLPESSPPHRRGDGEVARRVGGVMSISTGAHDPSGRCAATSPAKLGRNESSSPRSCPSP
jgi:uncharacterized protein